MSRDAECMQKLEGFFECTLRRGATNSKTQSGGWSAYDSELQADRQITPCGLFGRGLCLSSWKRDNVFCDETGSAVEGGDILGVFVRID